jgi:hypothetical protein
MPQHDIALSLSSTPGCHPGKQHARHACSAAAIGHQRPGRLITGAGYADVAAVMRFVFVSSARGRDSGQCSLIKGDKRALPRMTEVEFSTLFFSIVCETSSYRHNLYRQP